MNKPSYRDQGSAAVPGGDVINNYSTRYGSIKHYIKYIIWHQQEKAVLHTIYQQAKIEEL